MGRIRRNNLSFLFEKNQKIMSFLLAQMKELKKTSTPPASPILEAQPLLLSLRHFGILRPSKVLDGVFF